MNNIKATLVVIATVTLLGCASADRGKFKPLLQQDFSDITLDNTVQWQADAFPYDGPYSESGEFYLNKNIQPPPAYRHTVNIGHGDWLSGELYSRTNNPRLSDYLALVPDPTDSNNQVLKLTSPEHTDGVILRSTNPLPPNYRISLRIGFAHYGDHTTLNGYNTGDERAGPWRDFSSVGHNGFYWLSIFDRLPRPHNNIWMHHHRKFVIDSWDRKGFKHTMDIVALDGKSATHPLFGKTFISYIDRKWQLINNVPTDHYLPNQWYALTFTRTDSHYAFSVSGKFKNGGQTTYSGSINYHENCIYHYNQSPQQLAADCIDDGTQQFGDLTLPNWPKNSAYPDYFMLGDPHINYYEGHVLIDDIKLETL